MSDETTVELNRILEKHREKVAAARAAAELRARNDADARHDCGPGLREIAIPVLREWSKRLAVDGYPTSVDDRLGCRPPCLIFRLAPRGGPESSLTLACVTGQTIRFGMAVAGKDLGADLETSLAKLDSHVIVEELGRFVTQALDATIAQPDCGPPQSGRQVAS